MNSAFIIHQTSHFLCSHCTGSNIVSHVCIYIIVSADQRIHKNDGNVFFHCSLGRCNQRICIYRRKYNGIRLRINNIIQKINLHSRFLFRGIDNAAIHSGIFGRLFETGSYNAPEISNTLWNKHDIIRFLCRDARTTNHHHQGQYRCQNSLHLKKPPCS